jgi:predicted enzyme related to lactoylglutathione lyase
MSVRTNYPAGAPCWVETLQPQPRAAADFYAGVFDWHISGPGPMPCPGGEYFVAQRGSHDVAGIATLPPGGIPPSWSTFIRVNDCGETSARVTRAGGRVLAEPFDVLPAGRMAVVADPRGAVFALWEARERQGAQRINEAGAWSMSLLRTDDRAGAERFYGEVFGWTSQPLDGDDMLFRLPGYVGGEPQQPVPRDVVAVMTPLRKEDDFPPVWSVDFWIDDTDAAVDRIARLGGRVMVPRFDTPLFRTAVVADPAGAPFSISQLVRGNLHANA